MKRSLLLSGLAFFASGFGPHGSHYTPPPRPPPIPTPIPRLPSDAPVPSGGGRSGPTTPLGPSPGHPGGAATPPATARPPLPPLPITGTPDEFSPALWQTWWSYNHDAFIDVRACLQGRTATSGENPLVAERRALQAALGASLAGILREGDLDLVVRQALIALARISGVASQADVLARFALMHLALENPNLKEAALLALGLGGERAATWELLLGVLTDDAEGRERAASDGPIPFRLRAFAAYGLGLLGKRETAEAARREVVDALLRTLGREDALEREIRVACALALGLVPLPACASDAEAVDPAREKAGIHLCGGSQTDYLLAIAEDAEQDPWFRGHAAAALGRLAVHAGAGFAGEAGHRCRSRDELVRALLAVLRATEELQPVQHGCMLGLAVACDADGDDADEEARALLADSLKRGEPMAQRFALVALAAALGRPGTGADPDAGWKDGSELLLHDFARAKGARLPWNALALAVAGHGRGAHRSAFPASFGGALRLQLANARGPDDAAACALGLALLRQEDAGVRETLEKSFAKQARPFRAHGAFALGLLGASEAKPLLEAALADPGAKLDDVLAASIGLRLLGETRVVPDLVARFASLGKEERDDALALLRTLALLQDPAAGQPLLDILAGTKLHEEVRPALVWCVGVLADPESVDWTAAYANGVDYNFMPWSLRSPLGDGRGVLDWR